MPWRATVYVAFAAFEEMHFDTIQFEADGFFALVREIQETVVDMPEWFRVVPHPANPDCPLDAYADTLRCDLPGSPWGNECPITGYFEVEPFEDGLWVYSHAQERLAEYMEGPH